MQEFDHIEALWAKHTVDVKISADDMLKQAKKDVNSMRTKSLLNILGMSLSIIAVAAVWFLYDFTSIATHIGISIIILAVAVYTVILYFNHRVIAKNDFTENPNIFLQNLKIYQLQRHQLYNRLYWFYAFALSLGMGLYFYEILPNFELWQQVLILFLSFGWVIFCSTLLRKAVIKRDKERIALLIEKFERISNQFKETE
jgi:membrane protein YdbS with pleckstrin-like domain